MGLVLLERYLEQDSKSDAIRERYAKLASSTKEFSRALKYLETIPHDETNASLLNNKGVLYWQSGKVVKAYSLFESAFKKAQYEDDEKLSNIAISNYSSALLNAKEFDAVIAIYESLDSSFGITEAASESSIAKLVFCYFNAKLSVNRFQEVEGVANEVLSLQSSTSRLKFDLSAMMIYYYTMINVNLAKALECAENAFQLRIEVAPNDPDLQNIALSNLVFALAENDRLDEASYFAKRLRTDLKGSPIIIATLGLLAIRKGNVDRGHELYSRAIQLSVKKAQSKLLKKKMHFELAKQLSFSNPKAAVRHLKSARKIKGVGDPWPARALEREIENSLFKLENRLT